MIENVNESYGDHIVKDSAKNRGGAPLGNLNGIKLKDSELRQMAYQQYCEHLAKGKSKKSWCFQHSGFSCTWETMEKYLKDEVEFDPLHKKEAEAQGLAYWEGIVADAASGKNKNVNVAALQMLMRNKFGWDKPESLSARDGIPEAMEQFAILTAFLREKKEQ